MQIYFRRETPPVLPIPELQIVLDRVAHLPEKVSSKLGTTPYQEVRECSHFTI